MVTALLDKATSIIYMFCCSHMYVCMLNLCLIIAFSGWLGIFCETCMHLLILVQLSTYMYMSFGND